MKTARNEYCNGVRLRCWDNGGRSCDRYTVAYMDEKEARGLVACVGMSAAPFHPQGFGQHSACMPGRHLGRRVPLFSLPADCQRLVRQDCGAGVGV